MIAAILDVRPAARPGTVRARGATTDLVRLFALDRLPVHRQPLICRWHRGADGRLTCSWEPDIALFPQR
jgi:hypothetical protein